MKVFILNACAMVCENKPQQIISDTYNRMGFNENNNPTHSSDSKNAATENTVSNKLMDNVVDFSGGMLGI